MLPWTGEYTVGVNLSIITLSYTYLKPAALKYVHRPDKTLFYSESFSVCFGIAVSQSLMIKSLLSFLKEILRAPVDLLHD